MAKNNPNEKRGGYRPNAVTNSPIFNQPVLAEGDNAKYSNFLIQLSQLPRIDKHDVSALEKRFNEYLILCATNDMKVGNQAAYLAMGITKDDIYNWEHKGILTPQHCEFAKKVRQICATYRESLMQDGKINPVTGIFWQKNYDGMKDQQDLVVTPNTQRLSEMDTATIIEKYKELPED